MDSAPVQPDRCTRIVVRFTDTSTFCEISPFRIADEIREVIGDVRGAKATGEGALLITTLDYDQSCRILQLDRFLGKIITAEPAIRQETREGYAYVPSLSEVPDDEIITELRDQGVVGVRRLRPTNGRRNHGIRFLFIGNTIPDRIFAGYEAIRLRPWVPSPMLCRYCGKYGHTANRCRTKTPRCLRCAGAHPTPDCQNNHRLCLHCCGEHAAWERSCPVLQDHFRRETARLMKPCNEEQHQQEATTQTPDNKDTHSDVYTQTEDGNRPTADQATQADTTPADPPPPLPLKTKNATSQTTELPRPASPPPSPLPPPPPPPRPATRSYARAQDGEPAKQPWWAGCAAPPKKATQEEPWWAGCTAPPREAAKPPPTSLWGRRPTNFADNNKEDQPARKQSQNK